LINSNIGPSRTVFEILKL